MKDRKWFEARLNEAVIKTAELNAQIMATQTPDFVIDGPEPELIRVFQEWQYERVIRNFIDSEVLNA